ncbi:MAG: hypothetical protein CL946_03400 [Ectothiorhodospiraceae bacterium]|nr:hypothetical protein [Ectothiorhodospiraceae bacterium]
MLLFVAACVVPSSAFAQDIEFTGYGALGAEFFDKNPLVDYNQNFYFEGKFQANFEYKKDVEAQLDFRGESEENRVSLREYSVKFKGWKRLEIEVGNKKKPFGLEELEQREDFVAIDWSHVNQQFEEYGFAGRTLGILASYEYEDKDPGYPFSYHFGAFQNNSNTSFALARGSYHSGPMRYSLGYAYQSRTKEDMIQAHAFSADIAYLLKDFKTGFEGFYVQDPIESIRRNDTAVYSLGIKHLTEFEIDIDGSFIEEIEPFVLVTYFIPDSELQEYNVIDVRFGANFYIDNDIFLRLNIDGLFTKTRYSDGYSTDGSSVVLELLTRFKD